MQTVVRLPLPIVAGNKDYREHEALRRCRDEVPAEWIRELPALLLTRAPQSDGAGRSVVGLADAVDLSLIWLDATCAQLDIHDPSDWVLRRDVTRTSMKAIVTIRSHGQRHRLQAPERFIAAMNAPCLAMSGSSRRGRGGDQKRARQRVVRQM
jgi:hypothetical protein